MLKQRFLQAVVTVTAIATVVGFTAHETSAHHGWSEYNSQQTLNLAGEIQTITYGNPHTTIQLKSGSKVWTAVLAPSSRMERRGLQKGALKAGQTVRVVGYPHRSDANEMRAERITIAGKTTELR